MKTYSCDICGKEAKAHIEIDFESKFWENCARERYDLCKDCYASLKDKFQTMKAKSEVSK